MKAQRQRRLMVVIGLATLVAIAVGLMLYALRANINLFFTPSQVVAGEAPQGRTMRIGGMVKARSVERDEGSLQVTFVVTDFAADVPIHYDISCQTFSARVRAWSWSAHCATMAISWRARYLPSTTRITCLPRWPKH